jgi:predicted enzyme related to lactoylglutathione lyase
MMQRTYPHGVPCWIDTEQPDPEAAGRFYGGLFGWELTDAVPPGAPGSYLIATLDGHDAAAVAPAGDGPASWNTYVAVDDADASAAAVTAAGGRVVSGPEDAGPGGRTASCEDPHGAAFRLWQPRRRPGVQVTNTPGAWNFSDLHTPEPDAAMPFYATVFGWVAQPLGEGAGAPLMLRVPGYGAHLAATTDPDIRERQADVGVPPGFADAIGWLARADAGEPVHWHVTFAVAHRDESAATAERLGATVLSTGDDEWSRDALVRDPQGAVLTLSEFTPPG